MAMSKASRAANALRGPQPEGNPPHPHALPSQEAQTMDEYPPMMTEYGPGNRVHKRHPSPTSPAEPPQGHTCSPISPCAWS